MHYGCSYYMIYYGKFKNIMQQTEKVALSMSRHLEDTMNSESELHSSIIN